MDLRFPLEISKSAFPAQAVSAHAPPRRRRKQFDHAACYVAVRDNSIACLRLVHANYWPVTNQHGAKEFQKPTKRKMPHSGEAHHDPTVARVVAMNYAMCDQSLNGIGGLKGPSEMPNYDLMYPTPEEHLADPRLKNRTQTYYTKKRDRNDCRLKALKCIRAAKGTDVVIGTVMEGKRLVDLAENITAVPKQ